MNNKCLVNRENFMNVLWSHGEPMLDTLWTFCDLTVSKRWILCERYAISRWANAERMWTFCDLTLSQRWTHVNYCDRTVSQRWTHVNGECELTMNAEHKKRGMRARLTDGVWTMNKRNVSKEERFCE